MKEDLLGLIKDALQNQACHYEFNGDTIWVDSPDGKETYSITVQKCEADNV